MTKKEAFINYVEALMEETKLPINDDAFDYWNALKNKQEKEKPLITENGRKILQYLVENFEEKDSYYAKEIAAGLGINPKAVAGSMRKLVENGFVEKLGQDPASYALTEKGKEANQNHAE